MKKSFYAVIIALVVGIGAKVEAGDYGNGDLTTIINGATDGEVINLTGTAYTFSVRANTLTKSLTIQADPSLSSRPIITCGQAGIQFISRGNTAQTLVLKGLEINGGGLATGLTHGNNITGGNFTVTVDNCKTTNFATATAMFFYTALSGLSVYGDLTIKNSEFIGPYPLALLATTATNTSPNNITFSNCYVTGFNTANTSITVVATTALAGITIDHCTFQNGATGSRRVLTLPAGTPQVVKNCVFVDQPGTGANMIAVNVANDKNVVFNAGAASRWTNFGTLLITDPAEGLNGVATESSYINAGTDGKTIGYYGNVVAATVPGAPTSVVATPGNRKASIAFSAPASNGGAAITSYTVTSSPDGLTATGASSPLVVTGLTNTTSYTFDVTATNSVGTGSAATSASVTPDETSHIIALTTATSASLQTFTPVSDISISSAGSLVLDQNTNVSSITVADGGKLSIPTNTTTVSGTITLQSSAAGTATLVDDYTSPTRTATVQQYLSSARNWYFTPALTGVVVPASSTYFGYEEAGDNVDLSASGSSAYWKPYATGASLTTGKGYIIQAGGATTLSFTNTTVSGDVSPILTYNSGKGNGYNLVGNPYPSYLSWSAVYDFDFANGQTANMPTGTIWYRTVNYNGKSAWTGNTSYSLNDIVYNGVRFYKVTIAGTSAASGGPTGSTAGITDGTVTWDYQGSVYIFATVSASGVATPSMVNNLIPPMQAFWVKTATGGGTLRFKNSMRSHNTTGGTNALKAPKSKASDIKLIRLNVSNGASTDEIVIFVSANASNAFDSYDAPKYFNAAGSNQAEIYTQVGTEKLAINAMNELSLGTEIPLGFATEKGNNFTISASELRNFGLDTKVILKDNQTTAEFDLTSGQSYTFSSAAVNSTNRFSLLFRAPGTTTAVLNAEKLNAQVFVNAANQITIIAPENSSYSVYNVMGQKVETKKVMSTSTVLTNQYVSGIYFVTVSDELTKSVTHKVVVK